MFAHPKKKHLYIALADRWMGPQSSPEFESGETSRLLLSALTKALALPRQPLTSEEIAAVRLVTLKVNTSQARYVWLPVRFDR